MPFSPLERQSGALIEHLLDIFFTADETFEDTDSIALIKFNTSDIHGHTNEGKTHKVKVTKARVPSLSEYKNIIDLQE